ncbi:hypothetical protein A3K81_05165 [Candidatus Bathyarchaeota archaeon RBG_13_60_20]|nr:MAG: hypothetical protein A3K81_05165 [Candidatus Bathyarchaeota archaeon RBG_13_60_20]
MVCPRSIFAGSPSLQSIGLIRQAIKGMPEGSILVKHDRFPDGEAMYRTEQPRGEVFYYGKGDGTIHLERCRIRTPTIPNIPPLLRMLIGHEVADIPTIATASTRG